MWHLSQEASLGESALGCIRGGWEGGKIGKRERKDREDERGRRESRGKGRSEEGEKE